MIALSSLPFGNVTITIYNRYQYANAGGKLITRWIRTVIPKCFRTTSQKVATKSGTLIGEDYTVIQIPLYDNFLEPYDYAKIVKDEISNYFTANDGDVIVIRAVDDEIDEFMTDLNILTKYGSLAFKISNVSYNYGGGYPIQHIRVVS